MKLSKQAIIILLLASCGHFLVDLMIGVWPLFKLEVGLDVAIAAMVTGACVIVGEGLQVYFGSLADRGYSTALLIFGPICAAASAFLPYGSGVPFYALCLIVTYVGSSAFHPTAAGIVASLSATKTNIMVAIFHSSGLVGLALSQVLYSYTTVQRESKATWILALPSLVLAVLLIAFRKKLVRKAESSKQKQNVSALFKGFFKRKPLKWLYFTLLTNQIAAWSLIFLLPDLVVSRTSEAWIVLGGGHLIYVLGAACTAVPLGFFADKIKPHRVISMVTIGAAGSLYLLLTISHISPVALSLLLFTTGGLLGSIAPLSLAMGNILEPKERGAISAFLMGFVWIFSEGLGITLGGVLTSCFAEDAAVKSLLLMGFFALVSAYMAQKLVISMNAEVLDPCLQTSPL